MSTLAESAPAGAEDHLLTQFGAVVSRHPGRRAVSAPDGDLTYAELDRAASALATRLRRAGVGRDSVVPVIAEAGTTLLTALLAVVKAGGAYLPIDPANPPERIRRLVTTSRAAVVVATATTRAGLPADEHLQVVDPAGAGEPAGADPTGPPAPLSPHDLAYVIHTSGSTGEPKAVAVEHASVARLLTVTRSLFDLDENDVWTMFHSAAFDFSVWEIWGAWTTGARLVVVPYEISRSPERFWRLVSDQGVTVLSQTPSAFRQFIASDANLSPRHDDSLLELRLVVLGGERLDVEMLRPWFERHSSDRPRVVNMFGITETTVHATHRFVRPGDLNEPAISPIGEPLPHLGFHLLDEQGRPVPTGQPGELYVSGAGLARGYLHRPDLTGQRFLTLDSGLRVYRTGDRMRRTPTGYEYLGRTDDQLSVRGFRIEPQEVEAALTVLPEVGAAVVGTSEHGPGDVRLVARIVPPAGTAPDETWWEPLRPRLLARAAASLPRHMRPSTYLPAARIPLTPNGKADRNAVAAEDLDGPRAHHEPGPEIEAGIATVWQKILGISHFGPHDDFFDLGGTSLSVLRMFEQVNSTFATDLDLTVLIDGVTVAALADRVETARTTRNELAEAETR